MMDRFENHLAYRFIVVSKILSIMIGLIGFLAIIGWIFDVDFLKSISSTFIPMRLNTSLGFILTGCSLLLQQPSLYKNRTLLFIAKLLAMIILIIASLTFIENLTKYDFYIDQLIYQAPNNMPDHILHLRTSLAASTVFILIGIALLSLDIKHAVVVTQVSAFIIGLYGLFILTGLTFYIYVEFQIINYASASIHTAINFVLVSLALFFIRPNQGIMKTLISNTEGGKLARRLIPIATIVYIVFGYLRIFGEYSHFYDKDSGIALYSSVLLITSYIIIIIFSTRLMRSDKERKQAEAQLHKSLEEVNDLYNFAPCGYHSLNADSVFVRINQTELDWLGYTQEEVIGKMKFPDVLTPDSIEKFKKTFPEFKRTGYVKDLEFELIRKNKSTFTVLLNATSIKDPNGFFLMSRSTMVDISDRKHMDSALERSNKELQQFAYIASHDLQEPLRTVTSFAQLIQRKYKDKLDKEANEYIKFLIDATIRMQLLIDDLLDFSRVTSKAKPFAPTDCNQVLVHVINSLEMQIKEHQAVITYETLPIINADDIQISQVFQNLISNAIKFSEQTPRIHIAAKENKDAWEFSVKDNGIGIPSDQTDQIFIPFKRLHNAAQYPGTGMGLAICKKIIERHQGKIWVDSQLGSGSTFYFIIPKIISND